MTDPRVPLVLDTQWVKQQRARGGAIWVLDQTGRSWHADDQLGDHMGDVPDQVTDAVPPAHATQLAALMKRHFGHQVIAWLPFGDAWYRVETYWINVFVVLAIWPEPDADRHHIHVA